MKMRWIGLLLVVLLSAGCGGGYYRVAPEEYQGRVKTLGVLPLLVDATSTIQYPQRDELLTTLRQRSAGREARLLELLRRSRKYFDVRPVAADPVALAPRLLREGTLTARGKFSYRQYRFDATVLDELAKRNVVDALLIVVLNGVEQTSRRWDRIPKQYLDAQYNNIQATAMVVTPSGEVLWEYPGDVDGFLQLQYPDFDESHYNKTIETKVRFISLDGLDRALTEPDGGLFGQEDFPRLYRNYFEQLIGALRPGVSLRSADPQKPAPPR